MALCICAIAQLLYTYGRHKVDSAAFKSTGASLLWQISKMNWWANTWEMLQNFLIAFAYTESTSFATFISHGEYVTAKSQLNKKSLSSKVLHTELKTTSGFPPRTSLGTVQVYNAQCPGMQQVKCHASISVLIIQKK